MDYSLEDIERGVFGAFEIALGEPRDLIGLKDGPRFNRRDRERFLGSLELRYRITIDEDDAQKLDVGGYDSSAERYVFVPGQVIDYITSMVEVRE